MRPSRHPSSAPHARSRSGALRVPGLMPVRRSADARHRRRPGPRVFLMRRGESGGRGGGGAEGRAGCERAGRRLRAGQGGEWWVLYHKPELSSLSSSRGRCSAAYNPRTQAHLREGGEGCRAGACRTVAEGSAQRALRCAEEERLRVTAETETQRRARPCGSVAVGLLSRASSRR